jgi:hypothetical protein
MDGESDEALLTGRTSTAAKPPSEAFQKVETAKSEQSVRLGLREKSKQLKPQSRDLAQADSKGSHELCNVRGRHTFQTKSGAVRWCAGGRGGRAEVLRRTYPRTVVAASRFQSSKPPAREAPLRESSGTGLKIAKAPLHKRKCQKSVFLALSPCTTKIPDHRLGHQLPDDQ